MPGKPEDTLMYEEHMNTNMSNLRHGVFVENSPHDRARNIVMKDCPNCGLNFMTQIMPGEEMATIYTCDCGYKISHSQYANRT
jgi:predicted RNA-binding Zn-ribbon protein involved in translation (DUF1610 family)